jgi:hypothetical protein
MTIPIEGSTIEHFTPPSLANIPTPPVFTLRAGTRRDTLEFRHRMRSLNIQHHSEDDFRAEFRRGLQAGWSEELFAEHEPKLLEYWEAMDQFRTEYADSDAPPAFEHPYMDTAISLLGRVEEFWEKLSVMGADNEKYQAYFKPVVVSSFINGWTGIDVPFTREGGAVTIDRMYDVELALNALEDEHAGKVDGVSDTGLAWLELCGAAASRLSLKRPQEKNSVSPQPSSDDLNGSKTAGADKPSGSSKASEPSTEIPTA